MEGRKEEGSEGKDRISEVPLEIKQKILSSLCMKDAFATSYLSSPWRYTWVTLPSLSFGLKFFRQFCSYFDPLKMQSLYDNHGFKVKQPKKMKSLCDNHGFKVNQSKKKLALYDTNEFGVNPTLKNLALYDDDDCEILQSFYHDYDKFDLGVKNVVYVQLLEQILQVYIKKRGNFRVLEKLYLYVPKLSDSKIDEIVSKWVSFAKDNVKEFSFSTLEKRCFWYGILESKTLTKLVLGGCSLISEKRVKSPINLPSLKELRLVMVTYVDPKMLDVLLCGCGGSLEKLELMGGRGRGVSVLRLSGLSKLNYLKVMHLRDLSRVEIDAPALQYFTFIRFTSKECKVKVAPSNSCNNLVELFVNGCAISDDFFKDEFPHLKDVTLLDCPELKRIKIASTCLNRLMIKDCPNLAQIELNTPKMEIFHYSSTVNNNVITLLSDDCRIVRVFLLLQRPRRSTSTHNLWLSKVLALLANFSRAINLTFETNSKENMIIPQELRETFRPPLCGVRNLSFKVETSLTNHDVLQLLDSLLWLSSYPKEISLSGEDLRPILSIKFQYEDVSDKGPAQATNNCRRRVLKDFKIDAKTGVTNSDTIRELLEHAVYMWPASAIQLNYSPRYLDLNR